MCRWLFRSKKSRTAQRGARVRFSGTLFVVDASNCSLRCCFVRGMRLTKRFSTPRPSPLAARCGIGWCGGGRTFTWIDCASGSECVGEIGYVMRTVKRANYETLRTTCRSLRTTTVYVFSQAFREGKRYTIYLVLRLDGNRRSKSSRPCYNGDMRASLWLICIFACV